MLYSRALETTPGSYEKALRVERCKMIPTCVDVIKVKKEV